MYCFRRDKLESGHEVFFLARSSQEGSKLCEVELWLRGVVLGALRLKEDGGWEIWPDGRRCCSVCTDKVVEYYAAKHSDLANADRETILREGFTRELDLMPLIERASETLEALYQTGEGPFLVVDADGQVLLETKRAEEARHIMYRGRKPWFSKNRADGQTLRVVPASKFAVEQKTENLGRGE